MEGQIGNQYQLSRIEASDLARQQDADAQMKAMIDVVLETVMCRVDRAFLEFNEQLRANMPKKVDSIERYLYMLYGAQRSGHDVHKEIDDALKQFKEAAGI